MMLPVFRLLLCAAVAWSMALDSNTIKSSKEASESTERLRENTPQKTSRRGSEATSHSSQCSGPDCSASNRSCSNRAQRRGSSRDRDQDSFRDVDRVRDTEFNRTKAPEMSPCVRSSDCGEGLCCVRYLTVKRCQRIPSEGELCLQRGSKQRRRNLGRCDCAAGLTCTSDGAGLPQGQGAGQPKGKGQGVCVLKQRGQRKTRHSGKKQQTAENSC